MAKKVLGVSNVTRKNQVPAHPDLYVVPPRMNLYMKKNQEINNLYKKFVADEDHSVFSVDESFLDVTASLSYFHCETAYKMARIIQRVVYNHVGIYVTVGIGTIRYWLNWRWTMAPNIRQILLQNGGMIVYQILSGSCLL